MPVALTETDAFSAFVLLETFSEDENEIFVHAAGCKAILQSLSKSGSGSQFLENLTPWILGRCHYLLSVYQEIPDPPICLSDYIRCFSQLCKTAHPLERWNSATVEALNIFIADLMWTTTQWFEQFVLDDMRHLDSHGKPFFQGWLEFTKGQINDSRLQDEIKLAEEAVRRDGKDSCDPEHLTLIFSWARFKAINFLLEVYESSSPLERIQSAKVQIASANMIARARRFALKLNGKQDIFLVTGLVGLMLQDSDAFESIVPPLHS
jgi:hypothetical protein